MSNEYDGPELSRTQIESLIDEWVLNERDRRIVRRRMCDGICFELLGEEFDLSAQRVKQIVYKFRNKVLKRQLAGII